MFKTIKNNLFITTVYNIAIAMILYQLCRIAFYLVNISYFNGITPERFATICAGGTRFDLTAVLYTNIIYILMMLIPFKFRYNSNYQRAAKWVFFAFNTVGIIANCIDIPYFQFTNRRTTASVFSEFSNDNNIMSVIMQAAIGYWYVTIIGIALIASMWFLYHTPRQTPDNKPKLAINNWLYYIINTSILGVTLLFVVFGIRGGIGDFVRPITLSNANAYIKEPIEAAIVQNTPFCIIRTLGKKTYKDPHYFETEEELTSIYEPIITPHPNGEFRNKNVVILIMESFSKEFVGELNKDLDDGQYGGYTPFLDSLIREGLTFEHTFANGRKSIDAMPSILSSIPRLYEAYILTPYSNNKVDGIASKLAKKGYYTAFFHGAPNGSMGFDAFANVSGFKDYFGKDEYNNDADYDGTWAIWDEEFLQFFAQKLGTFQQPFMTTLFTASSHHPFKIPEKHKDAFIEEGGHPLHKCIRYSDYALRRFFDSVKDQPWYNNTIFVVVADHTNAPMLKKYITDAGRYMVPIVFYTPDGELKGRKQTIAQQIDIMPTLLGYLNYDEPYVAFGHNLLDSSYTHHYAINNQFQNIQLFTDDSLMFLFDNHSINSAFNFIKDTDLENDLINTISQERIDSAEILTKAIVQQYLQRMINNQLTLDSGN